MAMLELTNPDSKVPTPNMNRLAAEGIRFTDAHSPSAVCTPTRYALLTGRYAWRLPALKRGVTNGYSPLTIDTTRATVASVLQEHGYATAVVGKWHLGLGSTKPTDYELPLSPWPARCRIRLLFRHSRITRHAALRLGTQRIA